VKESRIRELEKALDDSLSFIMNFVELGKRN
jgi:hypothetical protein